MRHLTTIPIRLKTPDSEVKLKPGDAFKPKDPKTVKPLLTRGKVKPVSGVMAEKYKEPNLSKSTINCSSQKALLSIDYDLGMAKPLCSFRVFLDILLEDC